MRLVLMMAVVTVDKKADWMVEVKAVLSAA